MVDKKKIEKLRAEWENEQFQALHADARQTVMHVLRELDECYRDKTGHGFIRFLEERMKTPESICGKLERKGHSIHFDTAVKKLNDISGVRCICHSVREIYWAARQIGASTQFSVIKIKDYIRKPKKNGYESYHIVLEVPAAVGQTTYPVRVELQLRTLIMDAWAGMDNQISYKKGEVVPPQVQKSITKYAKIGRRLDKLIERTLEESYKNC